MYFSAKYFLYPFKYIPCIKQKHFKIIKIYPKIPTNKKLYLTLLKIFIKNSNIKSNYYLTVFIVETILILE